MKEFLTILLIAAMVLTLFGCVSGSGSTGSTDTTGSSGSTGPTEPSGPENLYQVDPQRNEAIVDDAGTVTVKNEGNARVFYQIFVGSFSDSNGDGIGDLRGIINRFDYLNDGNDNSGLSLGVEGIWLTPIFKSGSYHKYDVANYYQVDPQFGTEADLQELIDLCHSRNVKIILDLPINHTSSSHPWFQYFVNAQKDGNTDNRYYDYYSYADAPQPGKQYSAIAGVGKYYECNFSGDMPELNFDNEEVRQAVVEVARYYLDMGLDGFRFDAAKYIYYGENTRCVEFWDWYMAELRKIKPDIYTVAEVWDGDGVTIPYNSSTNCFNFSMSQTTGSIASAAKGGDVNRLTKYVEYYIQSIQKEKADAMLISFIANHDTDRAAGMLSVSTGQAFVGANLNILTPGSPFIYYGEEIGLKGSRGGANTDANRRLAMLWGDNDTIKDPVGTTYKPSSQTNGTVADQKPYSYSLLTHYKKLIMIRKVNPEIAYGTYTALELEGTKVGGFRSEYEGKSVVVLHNTTTEAYQIDLSTLGQDVAQMAIAAYAGLGTATLEGTVLTLQGQTSVVLR